MPRRLGQRCRHAFLLLDDFLLLALVPSNALELVRCCEGVSVAEYLEHLRPSTDSFARFRDVANHINPERLNLKRND